MRGDFSRFTYNPLNNYISVLKQQGRVDLDSDWNEQAELTSDYLRQITADAFGLLAVPLAPNGIVNDNSKAFSIWGYNNGPGGVFDFSISGGIIYIGGYLFKLTKNMTFRSQADYPEPEVPDKIGDLLVYLEAWKKSVNYIDDEAIREPALGGPDTCLRSKLIGQVRVLAADNLNSPDEACQFLSEYYPLSNINLTLQIEQSAHQLPLSFGEIDLGGGMIPGNLHYRIEIHRGMNGDGGLSEGVKWSDENAAMVTRAIKTIDNRNILVEEPEEVTGESFKPGDWVEISNIVTELQRQGGQMVQIEQLESTSSGLQVTLDAEVHPLLTRRKNGKIEHSLSPRLRRWSGYYPSLALKNTYDLGRGVKAVFASSDRKCHYESADYWTFAIRDREYNKRHAPQKSLPLGIKKYRHPLAIIKSGTKGEKIIDCRKFFKPLAEFGTGL
ncbi:MAG TPA: hypothetical protein DEO84_12215 [candidate division Zixibacteria bacterium]|nr:hypothetical protein [candidate division Zixibacteria bacterium]